MIKVITVLTKEEALEFISEKRKSDIDTMPGVHPKIKQAIRKYIADNIGYDKAPIAGISRYQGSDAEILKVGTGVSDYLNLASGSVLFELHMPEDMVVTLKVSDLFDYSKLVEEAQSEFEQELHLEQFNDVMQVGYVDSDTEDTISFLPFIDTTRCRFYALIDQSWGIGNFSVPGVEQVQLKTLGLF